MKEKEKNRKLLLESGLGQILLNVYTLNELYFECIAPRMSYSLNVLCRMHSSPVQLVSLQDLCRNKRILSRQVS